MTAPVPLVLELNAATKRFRPDVPAALDGLSLQLYQGEILSCLGPSGCGKTTLLRMIAGFERLDAGSIAIAGRRVSGQGYWQPPEQRNVGMVFQDYALFPHLSVAKNVGFGLASLPKGSETPAQRIAWVLELVGLGGVGDRYPHQLSGGQQQRVALARALAPRPSLILLDEPLSNLDVQVRLHLRQELRTILKAANTAAILVTHDQEEALSIADRVAVLRQGHLEQCATPEAIYLEPATRFVAEFVAQANFLPARRREEGWETALGRFCLPGAESATTAELMVRPEDLLLHPEADGPARVINRQFLGREHRYQVQLTTGLTLVVRAPLSKAIAVGDRVRLTAIATNLRLFPR
ncbi:MAG: ABC transporter ATP-binding protein [Spirulinaceae cyanobacterium SM2_1_0]|nr:ABC transporter ATP-binding protein [Spirulinaceae cyanobacterium SM2_1_0]